MTIKISGILKDGIGRPIPKCTIELKSKKTSLTVIVETEAQLGVDLTGSYNLSVEPGKYDVSLYIVGFPPKRVGVINVYSDSRPGTLNEFLMMPGESDLTPELVATFLKLRDEAEQAAKEAKESAKESAASADEAKTAAESSIDILNQVTEIHVDITNKHQQVGLDATEIKAAVEVAKSAADSAGTYANQAAGMAAAAETHNNQALWAAQDAEKAKAASEASAKSALSSSTAAGNSKIEAESAKGVAEAAALATAQDRAAVSADKQTVSNDKASAEQAADAASGSALAAESDKVRAEAAVVDASDSASVANASAVAATAAANSVKTLAAIGETLSSGSPASAEWDAENNTLIIGVPQGEKGEKGDSGPVSGVNEAPADGKIYGRKNSEWSEVGDLSLYPMAKDITFSNGSFIIFDSVMLSDQNISKVCEMPIRVDGLLYDVTVQFIPDAGWPTSLLMTVSYCNSSSYYEQSGYSQRLRLGETPRTINYVGDFMKEVQLGQTVDYKTTLSLTSPASPYLREGTCTGSIILSGTSVINDEKGIQIKRIQSYPALVQVHLMYPG